MSTGIPYVYRDGASAQVAAWRSAFIYTASNLYGQVLAGAAPDGALDTYICYAIGRSLGLRGRFTGLIEVGPDGELSVTPMDAWLNNGRWTGTTRPRDGDTGRTVTAPDAAVFHVRFPDGQAPVSRVNPLGELAAGLDGAMIDETEVPALRVIGLNPTAVAVTGTQRGDVDKSIEKATADGKRHATVVAEIEQSRFGTLQPDPSSAAVQLRAQVRDDVAAAFGVIGLLSEAQDASAHGDWRVATTRTFEPLARLVEDEAARKLDAPVRFHRPAFIAAPHSEIARAIAQRATAVQRLVAAGMEIDRAVALVGLEIGTGP